MASENWISLPRLKTAVKKMKFLLTFNLNVHQLRLTSSIVGNRRLSFKEPPRGLIVLAESETPGGALLRTASTSRVSGAGGQSDDDIDRKADLFIANFHRQLRIERQISLELHYCRGNSFTSVSA